MMWRAISGSPSVKAGGLVGAAPKLIFDGDVLDMDTSPKDFDMEDEDVLDLKYNSDDDNDEVIVHDRRVFS
jgi:hypothetical protein